jgi:hypothetical protein
MARVTGGEPPVHAHADRFRRAAPGVSLIPKLARCAAYSFANLGIEETLATASQTLPGCNQISFFRLRRFNLSNRCTRFWRRRNNGALREDAMPQRLRNFIAFPADVPDQHLQPKENVLVPHSVFESFSLTSSSTRAGNNQ